MRQPRFVAHYELPAANPLAATGEGLRWGVVSTGKIANTVTAQLALLEDAVLQAVSSRELTRAEEFAQRFGFRRAYGDSASGLAGYEQLAADPDVDVIYVATPHAQHHEVTKYLLRAGKHVLVEKAFTLNAQQAKELEDIAREEGRFLMEAVWTRFLPAYQRVLELLEVGEIGAVQYVQADLGVVASTDSRSRLWAPADGGGALLDLAVYPLTWVVGALGFPPIDQATIHATGRLNSEGVDELATIALDYPGGQQAQVLVSFVTHSTRRARIGGDKGVIVTGAPLTNPQALTLIRGNVTTHEEYPHAYPPYTYQLREVTRQVQRGATESPTMPLSHTLTMMELQDEVRRQIGLVYPAESP